MEESKTSSVGKKRKLQNLNDEGSEGKQILHFSKELGSQNLALFQVPPTLLSSLKAGDRISFAGPEENGTAVIISPTNTFELCKVESSNTMLLVPPVNHEISEQINSTQEEKNDVEKRDEKSGFQIEGMVTCTYEVKKTTPRLDQLEKILDTSIYNGAELEQSDRRDQLFSFGKICSCVQASPAEVQEGLEKLQAVEICGVWRRISSALMEKAFDAILNQVIEHDLPLDRISEAGVVAALSPQGHEPIVVRHCLRVYSISQEEDTSEREEGYWPLDMKKVAIFRAHQLFRKEEAIDDQPWPLDDFKVVWASRLPGVDSPEETLLKGVALKETRAGKTCLRYFPAERLSPDPQQRFQELFSTRSKWTLEDLSPYLAAIVNPLQSEADLLLTFARSTTDSSGEKLYSLR